MSTIRVLDAAAVRAAGGLGVAAAMDDIRVALAALRDGTAEMPAETSVSLGPAGTAQARAYALPARVGAWAGVKWTAHAPAGIVPSNRALSVVNDALTGQPIGLVDSVALTAVRTAAVSAFILDLRPPRRVAVLGAGRQGRAHLAMLAERFADLDGVALWNRTPKRAMQVAAGDFPWPVEVCETPEAACAGADVVMACTTSPAPYLGADAFGSGRMLMQIGYNEVRFSAIDRADAVVVDLWGDFCRTSAKSLFQMYRAGRFDPARVAADLAAVVLDGWRPGPGAALYFSSFGLNIFDIALAARVLSEAARRGVGLCIPWSGEETSQ